MAVPLEFISLIVPISVIDRIHPGGWAKFSEGMQFFEGGASSMMSIFSGMAP